MSYLDTIKEVRVRKFVVIDCDEVTFRVWEDGSVEVWHAEDGDYYHIDAGDYFAIDDQSPILFLNNKEHAAIRQFGLNAIKDQK